MPSAAVTASLRSVPVAGWIFLTWTIGGVLAFAAAGAIRLVLSNGTQLILLALSIAIGVFIVYWSLRVGRARGQSPALYKRILFAAGGVPVFALVSAANLYVALYAIHDVVAKPIEVHTFISASVREHIPWRSCSHWVWIKDAMYMFNKYCVADESGAQLHPGTPVLIDGSKSLVGFRTERISPLRANNAFESEAIQRRAPHGAPERGR